MRIEKAKFDDLLVRLLKAKPLPEKKVRAPEEREPTANIGRP